MSSRSITHADRNGGRKLAHWVRPKMVVEVSYAEWTPDGLLRYVVYLGEREDKLASNVRRDRASAENIVQTQRHIRG